MNRQKIRVIALAALLVAAGAYVWAQRTATTVKPAQAPNAAVKKPGIAPGAKTPAAPPAKTNAAAATKTANAAVPSAARAAATKAPVPPTAVAAKPPAVDLRTAGNAATKRAAVPPPPAAAVVTAAAPVEAAAWQDHLQKGAYLAEQLRTRLPAGSDLLAASAGFRDLQQFVAAVTAAHNLHLNFDELKRRLVTDGKGLASAIDGMRKVASATIEEQRAEYEARGLIQEAKRRPLPAKAVTTKEQPKKKTPTTRS